MPCVIHFKFAPGFQEEMATIHDLVYGATHLALDENDVESTYALDITFDTPSFSCELMRMFKNVIAIISDKQLLLGVQTY